MSSRDAGMAEEEQPRAKQLPPGGVYVLTSEEMKLRKECNQESFLYRSMPFSIISMAVTQALVTRGTLSASRRFGSLPKVAFAGFCGYLAGKLSYVKICQEKFMKLENSLLGEILRQKAGMPAQYSGGHQSELSDPDSQSFDSMFQSAEAPSQSSTRARDAEYGYSRGWPSQTGKADDFDPLAQSDVEEDDSRRKATVLYENLRQKNRENYEVTLTQKAERGAESPKKTKKNNYGDSWEE